MKNYKLILLVIFGLFIKLNTQAQTYTLVVTGVTDNSISIHYTGTEDTYTIELYNENGSLNQAKYRWKSGVGVTGVFQNLDAGKYYSIRVWGLDRRVKYTLKTGTTPYKYSLNTTIYNQGVSFVYTGNTLVSLKLFELAPNNNLIIPGKEITGVSYGFKGVFEGLTKNTNYVVRKRNCVISFNEI